MEINRSIVDYNILTKHYLFLFGKADKHYGRLGFAVVVNIAHIDLRMVFASCVYIHLRYHGDSSYTVLIVKRSIEI